jgi:hypothetical protein
MVGRSDGIAKVRNHCSFRWTEARNGRGRPVRTFELDGTQCALCIETLRTVARLSGSFVFTGGADVIPLASEERRTP